MKLNTLIEKVEHQGAYVGAKFTKATVARLKKFVKDHDIPNALTSEKFHTTLIYSRKYVDLKDQMGKLDPKWIGKPEKLEIFKTNGGWNALVLRYSCPEQKEWHERVMKESGATYDYPEYNIHLSLSYNIEDYDQDKLKTLSLDSIGEIEIKELYFEILDLDWASKTVKSD